MSRPTDALNEFLREVEEYLACHGDRKAEQLRIEARGWRVSLPSTKQESSALGNAQCATFPYPNDVDHWRARALKAEAELAVLKAQSESAEWPSEADVARAAVEIANSPLIESPKGLSPLSWHGLARAVLLAAHGGSAKVPQSESAPRFRAVGYVRALAGGTSTKYEPGRLPYGERMLYIVDERPNKEDEQ